MRTPMIVVAVDGTEPSRAAVRWAAREAELSNRSLLVLHILDWEWNASRYDFDGLHFAMAQEIADGIVARAAEHAKKVAPAISVVTGVRTGNPAAQLIIASEEGALMVLGHRGSGGFSELRLGSVSQRVATHAHSPVVVVRGRPDPYTGPVVVGVDDAESADAVLETAFAVARERGSGVTAVHAYVPVPPMYAGYLPAAQLQSEELDEAERARVLERLALWRAKYPDVPVETLMSHGTAASVLTGVSHTAQLVVVGSRGHGVIVGTLLGSTGLQLLHHAECPVLIVRES
ncbi:universal stress protein [Actinoplanes sp. NPDC023936]|uniref:universal stress protein n=1 Tax=Actinoplanes sp. NPDC023936 TaxID=3154910 RepID=UPI0033E86044